MERFNPDAGKDQSGNVEGGDVDGIAPSQNAITDVSETPSDVNIIDVLESGQFDTDACPNCGEEKLTDEPFCGECVYKPYHASIFDDGDYDQVDDYDPEWPECPECGQSLDTVFELKNGRCARHD